MQWINKTHMNIDMRTKWLEIVLFAKLNDDS